jgi:undecaprenyl-diphosphatase
VLLLLFDRASMTVKRIEHAGYGDAAALGLVQVLALIPGVGRIGVMVATARLLGFERPDAARFAFLISIPTLAGAVAWNSYGLVMSGAVFPTNTVLLCALLAFSAGVMTQAILMNWLKRQTFTPFAVYRIVMGATLVAFAYELI